MRQEKPSILIVDDEASIREVLCLSLENQYEVKQAENVKQALEILNSAEISVVISDLRMPDEDGLSLLKKIQENHPNMPVIMMTAYGSTQDAIDAMKLGAYDYLIKPFQLDILYTTIKKALEKYKNNIFISPDIEDVFEKHGMIGKCEAMQKLWQIVPKVASTRASILIIGENGTGKNLLSSLIHQQSDRKDGAFVILNCPSIADGMLERELLGQTSYKHIDQDCLLAQAHNGTLFIDEVATLSLNHQAKLLNLLQQQKFQNLHLKEEQSLNIRIIATSNQSLVQKVQEGLFREDLFFFLNVIPIYLPPLRDRISDLPKLCSFFLNKYHSQKSIDPKAMAYLQNQGFKGNVRELENMIERAMALSSSDQLKAEDFQSPFDPFSLKTTTHPLHQNLKQLLISSLEDQSEEELWDLEKTMQTLENQILKHALNQSATRTDAAKKLNISFRSLRYRLQKNGFQIDQEDE